MKNKIYYLLFTVLTCKNYFLRFIWVFGNHFEIWWKSKKIKNGNNVWGYQSQYILKFSQNIINFFFLI
jgi:hypothetical protein